ncbi:MAG: pantoate--beta-alanine ligase [Pseudobdellovibrio sp.]
MKVFNSLKEFIKYRDSISPEVSIGFVPTMGALHIGHVSLMKKSAEENDLSVLSIFVNPTQFNNPEDLKKYPRTLEADLKIAEEADIQFVILPSYQEIYPDDYRYQLIENDFSKKLCGAHREGHFNGVLTVVIKLLQIVAPQNAYFGKKDFQQFKLIEDMAQAFFLRTQIIGCETIREDDGLAMSSRNVRLTRLGRETAPLIYKALTTIKNLDEAREFLTTNKIEVEYLEEHFNRRFIAAFIDGVRLIDNVEC